MPHEHACANTIIQVLTHSLTHAANTHRQSKRGAVWNNEALVWANWEVLVRFNVNGVSKVQSLMDTLFPLFFGISMVFRFL